MTWVPVLVAGLFQGLLFQGSSWCVASLLFWDIDFWWRVMLCCWDEFVDRSLWCSFCSLQFFLQIRRVVKINYNSRSLWHFTWVTLIAYVGCKIQTCGDEKGLYFLRHDKCQIISPHSSPCFLFRFTQLIDMSFKGVNRYNCSQSSLSSHPSSPGCFFWSSIISKSTLLPSMLTRCFRHYLETLVVILRRRDFPPRTSTIWFGAIVLLLKGERGGLRCVVRAFELFVSRMKGIE